MLQPLMCGGKHPKYITGSLLPFHAYLILPGPFILHTPPIFYYKYFTQNTITKLNQTSITREEAAKVRFLSTPPHQRVWKNKSKSPNPAP